MEEVVLLWRLDTDDEDRGEDVDEGERCWRRCWVSFYVLFVCDVPFSSLFFSVRGD